MRKGDQLCILRAEVKTDADALNLLRLVAALTAIGIPLDDDCPISKRASWWKARSGGS